MEILLSMVLPAYNVASYIEACVESCENQDISKENYEIIIVNDGSTDRTLKIAEKLKNNYSNISVISQENQGLSMARNNGADLAKGKYLWFIDSDDKISKNCVKTVLNLIESEKLDILGVAPSNPFKEEFPIDEYEKFLTDKMSGRNWLKNSNFYCGAWGYIIKREFWKSLPYKFCKGICFEDEEFVPKMCYFAENVMSLNGFSCYNYIQRDGSIMHSEMTEKKINDLALIINRHEEFKDSYIMDDKVLRGIFDVRMSSFYMCGLTNIGKRKGALKTLKSWLSKIDHMPSSIYAEGKLGKYYQWLAFHAPYMFCSIKILQTKLLGKS